MRGGWVAGLIELTVYLLGFTVTGRLAARSFKADGATSGEDVLAVVALAVLWPLVAVVAVGSGLLLALGALFGMGKQ